MGAFQNKSAFDYLLDARLSDEEEAEIEKVIREHNHQFIDYHKLKTRKSGNIKHIDFHITVAPNLTVEETHDIIGLIVILYTPLSGFLKLAPLSLNQLIIAVVIAIASVSWYELVKVVKYIRK